MKAFYFLFFAVFLLMNISCRSNEGVNDTAGRNYIEPLEIYKVISPAEGIKWKAGLIYKIRWTSSENSGPIDLAIVKKKIYYETIIARGVENTGEFIWQVPDETISSVHYQVRINLSSRSEYVWYSKEFIIY